MKRETMDRRGRDVEFAVAGERRNMFPPKLRKYQEDRAAGRSIPEAAAQALDRIDKSRIETGALRVGGSRR